MKMEVLEQHQQLAPPAAAAAHYFGPTDQVLTAGIALEEGNSNGGPTSPSNASSSRLELMAAVATQEQELQHQVHQQQQVVQVDPQLMQQIAAASAVSADGGRAIITGLSTIEPLDVGAAGVVVPISSVGGVGATVTDLVFAAVGPDEPEEQV